MNTIDIPDHLFPMFLDWVAAQGKHVTCRPIMTDHCCGKCNKPPNDQKAIHMNTINLDAAAETMDELSNALKSAHADAITAHDNFAEIALANLLERSVELRYMVQRAAESAR